LNKEALARISMFSILPSGRKAAELWPTASSWRHRRLDGVQPVGGGPILHPALPASS
jgi:hypothetical protein